MQRLRRGALLALALSLALISGAFAGDNAGVTFSLTSPATVSGVGAGSSVSLEISAVGFVGVKNIDVFVDVSDAALFNIAGATLALDPVSLAGFIGLQAQVVSDTQLRLGAANFTATKTGDAIFTITIPTTDAMTAETEASVTIAKISIGPSATERDEFVAADLGIGVTVNPPVSDPTLVASSATDVSTDFSAVGGGAADDGSAGEVSVGVIFADATGAAAAGQSIEFAVSNSGAESIYVDGAEVAAGGSSTVTVSTDASGNAAILLDSEGGKLAGSTSATVTVSTSADNSEGTSLALSADFAITWDVPVPAELASFGGSFTPQSHVNLSWAVPSQSNNLGWEIYRSIDNESFGRVGDLVSGEGTVNELRTYEFLDQEPPLSDFVYYYLRQVDFDGSASRSQTIEVSLTTVAALPTAMALQQNYPNPFNPETTIRFDVANQAQVSVRIFDITGQVVRTLVSANLPAGTYTEMWDGRSDAGLRVGSGVYFYELRAGAFSSMQKMTLLQ